MTTTNEKGRSSCQSATPKTTALDSKDMSSEAQRKRVLEYLRSSPKTTYNLRALGISHPAARVRELVARGYRILAERITAVDSDGFTHQNVARYTLVGEASE
ncbi:Helix-turn-helix domain-containing protein [Cupriavidus necator]|uniref:helix-turn-helix domain-containing protein n=1 Tax=Cupriavidus necator TaxID=106590 RepID=UPI003F740DCB